MRRIHHLAPLAVVILFAACSADTPSGSGRRDSPVETAPATSPSIDQPAVEPASAVGKVVSLSPTATEMLFAIGAGEQVSAVDDQSDYPTQVLDKPHDLSAAQTDVDAIAAFEPDLVVIGADVNGLAERLEARGMTVWSGPLPTSFDIVYDQIEQLGALTGHVDEAAALVLQMRTDINAAVDATPSQPLTYYHEIDNTFVSVTENTFVGQVYSLFGLQSIADFEEVSSDNPQLSSDVVISAEPDVIFLADGETAATVAARPGWDSLRAVTDGNVVVVDGEVSSRWGPRIVDYVKVVSAAVAKAAS